MSVYETTYTATYGGYPTFPATGLECQLSLGGTWTDITGYVSHGDAPVKITRGRSDETTQATPSTAVMKWSNLDGRFSPRNPSGPYYGELGRNTPLRLSVNDAGTRLRMEDDTVSCAQAAFTPVTGDIDVRLETGLSGYQPCTLAGQWASSERAWCIVLNDTGTISWYWTTDGSTILAVTSSVPIPLGHLAIRVTRAHSTGVVTWYTASSISGSWTQLGATATGGTGNLYASTADLQAGYVAGLNADYPAFGGPSGLFYALQVYSGIGGTLVASPAFSTQTAGATSFTDGYGNTWTVEGTAELSNRKYRFHGECSALPQQWDPSGSDIWTPVEAAGILRRLGQGTAPALSAIRRAILQLGNLAGYWPCEDGTGATVIASGLPGGVAAQFTGTPGFENQPGEADSDSEFTCSAALPQVNSSSWSGKVPAYTGGTANVMRFLLYETAGDIPNNTVIASMRTSGTVARADLFYLTGGTLNLSGYDATGTQLFSESGSFGIDGQPVRVSVELKQDGTGVQYAIATLAPGASSATDLSGVLASSSIGQATSWQVNPFSAACGSAVIGQVSIQSAWDSLFDLNDDLLPGGTYTGALNAWAGETAGDRFARLCSENGIACRVYGYPAVTVPMGGQAVATLLDLLQECETADRGLIYEPRTTLGLGYRTSHSMCAQAPELTLDYDQDQLQAPLSPTDDDQYTVNDWVLTMGNASSSGASFELALDDGSPMSTGVIGDYNNTQTVNVATYGWLQDETGWYLNISDCDEERYPVICCDLAASGIWADASLYGQVQDLDIGGHLALLTALTPWLPPGTISQLMYGVTEIIADFTYQDAWNCVPESPYEVAVETAAHADTAGSSLASSATSAATTLSVATTAGPLWTTSSSDFPFAVVISGEEITVTNITGSSSPQTFTVTRSVNGVVKAQAAGAAVALYNVPIAALV